MDHDYSQVDGLHGVQVDGLHGVQCEQGKQGIPSQYLAAMMNWEAGWDRPQDDWGLTCSHPLGQKLSDTLKIFKRA